METRRTESGPWSGWLAFAAIMLALIGVFNIIDALTALFNDDYYLVGSNGLLVFDFTTWGIFHLIGGIVMVVAAWALMAGESWGRWVALLVAGLNAIAQVTFLSAYPLWSLLVITLDIVVIYTLTARWQEATEEL
jgi:hypothetical protein